MDNRTLEIEITGVKILSAHWNSHTVNKEDPITLSFASFITLLEIFIFDFLQYLN